MVDTRDEGSHQAEERVLSGLVNLWGWRQPGGTGRPSGTWLWQWLKKKLGGGRSLTRLSDCLKAILANCQVSQEGEAVLYEHCVWCF